MDSRAIQQAQTRLRTCQETLDGLRQSKSYQDFSGHWYVFLVAWKNIYVLLEQGAKASAQSRQWFGAKKAERRNDELLQYLFEARNSDEHGLEETTEFRPGHLHIGVMGAGLSNAIRLDGTFGPGQTMRVTSLDGLPIGVEQKPSRIVLAVVYARGNRTLLPPTKHKGVLLPDQEPLTVAALAPTYVENLVSEASSLT